MIFGVLKEPAFETRVSLLPDACATLIKKGHEVWVECSAGEKAFSQDDDYAKTGAKLASRSEVISSANLLLSIQMPDDTLPQGKALLGVYQPLFHTDKIRSWNGAGLTVFSLDMLPRTTRAQSMDVLSSQANIAGYKAVLTAATAYSRYFPMFMTAAGSIPPAKVLILGAGVAGLQAIATARRLGAVVEVFDTRPAVKEEVMSLGAKFVEVEGGADASKAGGYAVEQTEDYKRKQQQRIAESIAKADIVITTAQIPGKKAPILVTSEMMDAMRDGSVIVDLAAATGGNTPATKNNESVRYKGVTIIGDSNLAASMPSDASKLYGKNVLNFLQILFDKEGKFKVDFNDDLIKGACMAHEGKLHERIQ